MIVSRIRSSRIAFFAAAGLLLSSFAHAQETPSNGNRAGTRPLALAGDELQQHIDKAIDATLKRRLTAGVHTPWQVVHGILALRWDFKLLTGKGNEEIGAIEWIMGGQQFDGMPLWEETPYGGRGHPFTRPYAFEGHPTQFMGYMSMADIPLGYEIKTPTKVITIRDILNDSKMQVREGPEITWTLWALSHYEEPDAQWFNSAGEPWSIERLMRLQVDEVVTNAACGGTHGMFALSYARNMYISTGKPLRGVWAEADQKIKRYVMEAQALQNPDGSFSANHFKGPGYSSDFPVRIATSGHQLEWLMIALPQSKLKEEWFRRAITNIANDLIENRHVASDCGPLFHAVHALVVYRQRTVPGYRFPECNSPLKLADRGKKSEPQKVPATAKAETNTATPKADPLTARPEPISVIKPIRISPNAPEIHSPYKVERSPSAHFEDPTTRK